MDREAWWAWGHKKVRHDLVTKQQQKSFKAEVGIL